MKAIVDKDVKERAHEVASEILAEYHKQGKDALPTETEVRKIIEKIYVQAFFEGASYGWSVKPDIIGF